MRIRNKELRQRWHRKEQTIKELKRQAIAGGGKPKAEKAAAPAKKAAAPKAEKPKAAPKKAEGAEAEAKPKKAPAKKKEAEPAAD